MRRLERFEGQYDSVTHKNYISYDSEELEISGIHGYKIQGIRIYVYAPIHMVTSEDGIPLSPSSLFTSMYGETRWKRGSATNVFQMSP